VETSDISGKVDSCRAVKTAIGMQAIPARFIDRQKNSRGQALIEIAFMAPLIVFLIVAVADLGVFLVAAIGVQNSVRAAALYASSSTATAVHSKTMPICFASLKKSFRGWAGVSMNPRRWWMRGYPTVRG